MSLLQRLMAPAKSRAEVLDEEIVELRRQEAEDLRQLQEELLSRGPSEADQKVEALRRQQALVAQRVRRRGRPRVPEPWRCYLDMDTGKWYYHNEAGWLENGHFNSFSDGVYEDFRGF